MATGGTRNLPQPEQVADAEPGVVAGRAEGAAVEGQGGEDARR